uniref:Large neutral amino acids transporter small subunit 1 n=1 Tax=Elaeophora elaphi TaxID=1147741 RepID=A0A0R3RJK1_9BILA
MEVSDGSASNKVRLERRISLFNGCAIIIGVIVGSGIFVSPKGVLIKSGSVGLSLLIWILSGTFATMGAFIYAELGTTIPKSGGEYAYINEAFGSLPAFLFLWVALIMINPTSNAIMALTFAQYTLQPFFKNCELPDNAVRLLAACIICLLTFINCCSVKWSMRIQNIFSLAKVASLCVIIVTGIFWLCLGNTEHFEPSVLFEGTQTHPGHIALAFYSGVFSFSGWNSLNFVTEELINPHKNLPRAIMISLFSVTAIYMLVNISYFAVLSVPEVLASHAVAITFAEVSMGRFASIMPIFVAISCAGGLNSLIFAASRMFFVGARDGMLPELLSMISINYLTPLPSLLILGILSLLMLVTSNIYLLINYLTFTEAFVISLSVAGLIKLRFTQPNLHRPIKHNILLLVTFLIICIALVMSPFFTQPTELIIGVLIILAGIPFYFVFLFWKNKPAGLYKPWISMTHGIQKLLYCVPDEEHVD